MTSSLQFGKLHDLIASSLANYTFIHSVTTDDLDGSCAFTLALAVPDVTLIQTLACDDGTFASICREAVPPSKMKSKGYSYHPSKIDQIQTLVSNQNQLNIQIHRIRRRGRTLIDSNLLRPTA